jgi:hypothetical protein
MTAAVRPVAMRAVPSAMYDLPVATDGALVPCSDACRIRCRLNDVNTPLSMTERLALRAASASGDPSRIPSRPGTNGNRTNGFSSVASASATCKSLGVSAIGGYSMLPLSSRRPVAASHLSSTSDGILRLPKLGSKLVVVDVSATCRTALENRAALQDVEHYLLHAEARAERMMRVPHLVRRV